MEKINLKTISDIYIKNLWATPIAINYLIEIRKLTEDTIVKYNIGYAKNNLAFKWANQNKCIPQATKQGIIKQNKQDFFEGYLTFPIIATSGEYYNIYGRALGKINPPHKILPNSDKKIIYNQQALNTGSLFITESPIDTLSLTQAGINSCAIFGAKIPNKIVPQFKNKVCYLLFDNDYAGKIGISSGSQKLLKVAKKVFNVGIPERYNDVNEYCVKVKCATDRIKFIAKNSKPLLEAPVSPVKNPLASLKGSKQFDKLDVVVVGRKICKELNIKYIDKGTELWIQCPYHAGGRETKPSVWIGGQKNIFNCFACQVAGNSWLLIKWLSQWEDGEVDRWLKALVVL